MGVYVCKKKEQERETERKKWKERVSLTQRCCNKIARLGTKTVNSYPIIKL
jgi:hypothetical protein